MRYRFWLVLVFSSVALADSGPFSVESAIYRVEVPSLDGRSISQGTGVLIAQDKILTNCHVVKGGGAPGVIHRQTGSASIQLAITVWALLTLACFVAASLAVLPRCLLRQGKVKALGSSVIRVLCPWLSRVRLREWRNSRPVDHLSLLRFVLLVRLGGQLSMRGAR